MLFGRRGRRIVRRWGGLMGGGGGLNRGVGPNFILLCFMLLLFALCFRQWYVGCAFLGAMHASVVIVLEDGSYR